MQIQNMRVNRGQPIQQAGQPVPFVGPAQQNVVPINGNNNPAGNNNNNPFLSISTPLVVSPRKTRYGKRMISVNSDYSEPLVSIHEDYHNSPEIKKDLTKHYYYKIFDGWIFDDYMFRKLTRFFNIFGKKVRLIKSTLEYNKNKNYRERDIVKISYYFEHRISMKKIKRFIQKFIDDKEINWTDLVSKEDRLKKFLYIKLKKYLTSKVKKSRRR